MVGVATISFTAGWAAGSGQASHPWVEVVRSYWKVHVVHRQAPLELTQVMQGFGLPIAFTTETEIGAISSALISLSAVGLKAWRHRRVAMAVGA
mmetsp:Transcript_22438/g.52208  ORF Transcript_22438/g.52208 Transcript_22438/m.52208 type:complete len:94 (-) Transcript_22438:620-901(-)